MLALLAAVACMPPLAAAGDDLPEPPEPRPDAGGRYLSPYADNGTLAPWVATVMADKLEVDFGALAAGAEAGRGIAGAADLALALSSERPQALEQEFSALMRGLGAGADADDLREGMRLARLIGESDPERIISQLGAEVTRTVAREAFARVAGEAGGLSGLLGPIASLAAAAGDNGRPSRPRVAIDRLRHQADRSFDRLDRMIVHTIVYYRTRDDFEYALEAVLQTYPAARDELDAAMRRAGRIVHAEVRRMGGAGSMDIEWVSGDD